MKNIIGPPVSGENFANRSAEIARAKLLMEDGNSFLLLGIRRTGKSSLLKEIARQMNNNGWQTIFVNCSTCNTVLQFYQFLYSALTDDLREQMLGSLKYARSLPTPLIEWVTSTNAQISVQQGWSVYYDNLSQITGAFLSKANHTVVFLDELPFFFQNLGNSAKSIREIQSILTALRNWRDTGLAMGIAGSLNIHLQLEHLGISRKLLTGLNTLPVEPFSLEMAQSLLQQLVDTKQYDWWTPEISAKFLSLLPDYVPYFIQYAFNAVAAAKCDTPEKVERIYHNTVTPGLFKDFLYQFDERISRFNKEDTMIATSILNQIAEHEHITLSQLQQHAQFRYDVLIRLLDLEFLATKGEDTYSFSLNFIRQWWLKKSR